MCEVDNSRQINTLRKRCVTSKSKWIKAWDIVTLLESGFLPVWETSRGDFSPVWENQFSRVDDIAPHGYECSFCGCHCPCFRTEQRAFISRSGAKIWGIVENFFDRKGRKKATIWDDVLQKGGGGGKEERRCRLQTEVFPGQSATNCCFAFQVFAYKHKAKNTFGNIQLAQSLGN